MESDDIFRRLRGALGYALVWGSGWSILFLAAFPLLRLTGILPQTMPWTDGFILAAILGTVGVFSGGMFAGAVNLLYRGRSLSQINWLRFGIAGGTFTGLLIPTFFQTMNWLSGDGFVPVELVLDDALITAVFGGLAAAASLKLAQQVEPPALETGRDPPRVSSRTSFEVAPE
jgi:hypothetical protein